MRGSHHQTKWWPVSASLLQAMLMKEMHAFWFGKKIPGTPNRQKSSVCKETKEPVFPCSPKRFLVCQVFFFRPQSHAKVMAVVEGDLTSIGNISETLDGLFALALWGVV